MCAVARNRPVDCGHQRNNQGFLLWVQKLQLERMTHAARLMYWYDISHPDCLKFYELAIDDPE